MSWNIRLPSNAIQKAVVTRLKADVANVTVGEFIAEDSTMPFVVVPSPYVRNQSTKTMNRFAATMAIDVFSSYEGAKEVVEVSDQICQVLTSAFSLDLSAEHFGLVGPVFVDARPSIETNGATLRRHMVLSFDFIIQQL
jgi:hypothetical protein